MSALLAKFTATHTTDDWLDRRAALEAGERKARGLKEANDWLDQHHPRFRKGG
jgi:hypothetical protein